MGRYGAQAAQYSSMKSQVASRLNALDGIASSILRSMSEENDYIYARISGGVNAIAGQKNAIIGKMNAIAGALAAKAAELDKKEEEEAKRRAQSATTLKKNKA